MTYSSRRLKYVAFPRSAKVPFTVGERQYIGLEDIEPWTGRVVKSKPSEPDGTVSLFEANDVLFGKLRPYLAKVTLATEAGACSPEALVLRTRSNYSPSFLKYVLLDAKRIDEINSSTFGAKMPRASWHFIGTCKVPAPDLDAQELIAQHLDRETARIDELVRKKQGFNQILGERLAAAIDDAVLGATLPQAKPNVERRGYLNSIPRGWSIKPLRELVNPYRPIMYGIVLPGPHVDEGVPIVKGGDVKSHRLRLASLSRTTHEIEAGYARSRLRAGDLVISIRGGIGDVEIIPAEIEGANLTQDAARIAPRVGVSGEWLRFALRSPTLFAHLAAGATGAAVKGINIFDLNQTPIPTPPPDVQATIAAKLAALEAQTTQLQLLVARNLDLLAERRAAVVTAAVEGQIEYRTSCADPDTHRREEMAS